LTDETSNIFASCNKSNLETRPIIKSLVEVMGRNKNTLQMIFAGVRDVAK